MYTEFVNEFELSEETKGQLASLLKISFPEVNYNGRHYFKQLPHYRLLLKNNSLVIGQLALDFRVMTLDGIPINVLGVIDFAIAPEFRRNGNGKFLMQQLLDKAYFFKNNIDFIFLVTDTPIIYRNFGFKSTSQIVRWLATEEHINYGIKEELINDCFLMYKKIGNKEWSDNSVLDLMGYWY